MGFGEPKMPTPEEMAAIYKKRTLSDAELLKNGAEYSVDKDGNARLIPENYQIEKIKKEMVEGSKENLFVQFDEFPGFSMKVAIKNEKVAEVLEDVYETGFISYSEYAFKDALAPFVKAGIKVDYEPWTSEDGEDFEGYVSIKKEDINEALSQGKISFSKDEEGDLKIDKIV